MSVSVWGYSGTVLSLSYDSRERERDGARNGVTEGGERDTEIERGMDGRRELFFLLPPRERERVAGGREGERDVERER